MSWAGPADHDAPEEPGEALDLDRDLCPRVPANDQDPVRWERSRRIRALEASYEAKRQARLERPLYPMDDPAELLAGARDERR